MLSIPGRVPLSDMIDQANLFLWEIFSVWVDKQQGGRIDVKPFPEGWDGYDLEEWLPSKGKNDPLKGANFELLTENIRVAARLLCYGIATARGGRIEILSPYGTTPSAPIELFGKPAHGRESWLEDPIMLPHQFYSSYWQRHFMSRALFAPVHYGCLDWGLGAVDVGLLEASASAARAIRERQSPPAEYRLGRDGLLSMLRPYHGCPLIVPAEWLAAFSAEEEDRRRKEAQSARHVMPARLDGMGPIEKIIAFKDANPSATKADVQLALFQKMGERQFLRYFALAAEQRPELSKPGRKPTPQG